MAWRILTSPLVNKFHFFSYSSTTFLLRRKTSLNYVICKVYVQEGHQFKLPYTSPPLGCLSFHSTPFLKVNNDKVVEQPQYCDGDVKVTTRKKLKGKRAVVRWLKFFRFKKKKEFQRMTTEERILYKLLKVTGRSLTQVLEIASRVKKQGKTPKWWDPFPDPALVGALVHRAALLVYCNQGNNDLIQEQGWSKRTLCVSQSKTFTVLYEGQSLLFERFMKARKKEERLREALKKIEPTESSETIHDPEILTPEEHFFFLKMGLKSKNYVPVGRRGIYQGVILNMHLHWKKHQTLQVVVKTFSAEEVKEIATELARLTGGIVLGIHEDDTIIMYRGKNYSQPPTEIMSPRVTLPRKKALDKSKYRDGLRAVRRYIPKLEQELEILRAQLQSTAESNTEAAEGIQISDKVSVEPSSVSNLQLEKLDKVGAMFNDNNGCSEDEAHMDSDLDSYSDKLSDIFETDSDTEDLVKEEKPLYLDEFNNFPEQSDGDTDDFEEHLQQISYNSKNMEKDADLPKFDEVDQIFLRAASFLKKKRK